MQSGNKGLISISGSIIAEPMYEDITYIGSTEIYAVRQNGVNKLINISNDVIQELGQDEVIHIRGDAIIVARNGQYGIINRNGEEIVPFSYETLRHAFGENYIARREGLYGIINISGETMLEFEYLSMTYIETGDFIKADRTEIETVIIDNNFEERLVRNSFRT